MSDSNSDSDKARPQTQPDMPARDDDTSGDGQTDPPIEDPDIASGHRHDAKDR